MNCWASIGIKMVSGRGTHPVRKLMMQNSAMSCRLLDRLNHRLLAMLGPDAG
jgi:hypothetical protein